MNTTSKTILVADGCGFVALTNNHLYRIDHPAGRQIRVTQGEIWLTQTNNPADIILRAGDIFLPEKNGMVLMEVTTLAHIRVEMANQKGLGNTDNVFYQDPQQLLAA